jgi:low affinity Fe/Cu permease
VPTRGYRHNRRMPDKKPTLTETDRWGVLRHPTERREGRGRFDALAESASNLASSALFFSLCFVILAVWVLGLVLGFAAGTESALTGTMSALTLLLVALLKNSELRAERAMQLKLDAIASALLEDRGRGPDAETRQELEEAVRLHEEL